MPRRGLLLVVLLAACSERTLGECDAARPCSGKLVCIRFECQRPCVAESDCNAGESCVSGSCRAGGATPGDDGSPADVGPAMALVTVLSSGVSNDLAGRSLALVDDVNGDGWRELLVGTPGYPAGGLSSAGAAYLFLSASSLEGFAAPLILESPAPEAGAACGNVVRGLTDVNGDGAGDVAVGCSQAMASEGGVYVYLSAAGSMALAPAITLQSPGSRWSDWFGTALLEIPDRNGDGRPELAVSALLNTVDPAVRCGSIFVFPSAPGGYDAAGVGELPNPTPAQGEYFSPSLALVPDVTGDGHPELLAADDTDSASRFYGAAYVFASGPAAPPYFAASPLATLFGPATNGNTVYGEFGLRVFSLTDRNGDGTAELLVYANGNSTGAANAGALFLFRSSNLTWQAGDYLFIPSPQPTVAGRFGLAVVELPDRSGDGLSELLIGQSGDDTQGTDAGALFVYTGSASSRVLSPVPAGKFGASLLVGEDRNGDGVSDLFVGAPGTTGSAGQVIILRAGVP